MRTPDQDMALPGRDSLEQEQGEIFWSCLGMLSRNRKSLFCIHLCIYSHLETYMVLVEQLKKEKNYDNYGLQFSK